VLQLLALLSSVFLFGFLGHQHHYDDNERRAKELFNNGLIIFPSTFSWNRPGNEFQEYGGGTPGFSFQLHFEAHTKKKHD
jgi:hypothetical protein